MIFVTSTDIRKDTWTCVNRLREQRQCSNGLNRWIRIFSLWQMEGITSPRCFLICITWSFSPPVSMVKGIMNSIYQLVYRLSYSGKGILSESSSPVQWIKTPSFEVFNWSSLIPRLSPAPFSWPHMWPLNLRSGRRPGITSMSSNRKVDSTWRMWTWFQ